MGLVTLITFYPDLTGEYWVSSRDVYIFKDLSGPTNLSTISPEINSSWHVYDHPSLNRLAIFLTDENSAWLGLVHGFKTIGIPFRITNQLDEALKHNLILVYPAISGKLLQAEQLKKIAKHIREGGSVIGINILGGGLNEIFGFKTVISSKNNSTITLKNNHPVLKDFDDVDLRTIRLNDKKSTESRFGSNSYLGQKHPPLAVYDDESAAIVYNQFENSEVYAIGFDIGFYLLKAYNRRLGNVATSYANGFEPSVDNLLRLFKYIYQRHVPDAVTLGTVPQGHSLSVILTHDIDYNHSLKNAISYAQHEYETKTSGTYFLQTKYIRDWNDEIFFNTDNLKFINQLNKLNVEIASHSVSHSRMFSSFAMGDGTEKYPDYRPFVKNRDKTYNGTILGELRVSKFLIDQFVPDFKVVSFRPGYLANPLSLPQALFSTEYKYSSSVTANVSLTHLPFKLNYNRDVNSEVEVFEFPITVEDEIPPKMGNRIEQAITLGKKIARYGGIFVELIHPDILDHKLKFQKEFVNAIKPLAWFGTLREFGDWWSARDKVEIDSNEGKNKVITLTIPKIITGLVIEYPVSWKLSKTIPESVEFQERPGNLILGKVHGKIELLFNNYAE